MLVCFLIHTFQAPQRSLNKSYPRKKNKYKLFACRCYDKSAYFVTIPTLLILFAKKIYECLFQDINFFAFKVAN